MPSPQKIHCSRITARGQPCQAWAVHGSDPPACSAHAGRNTGAGAPTGNQNRRTHGFYSAAIENGEIADLIAYADDLSLDDEIALVRVALRRLVAAFGADAELDPGQLATLATTAFNGSRTVARLLRDKRAISGEAADGISAAMATVLDELGTQWGIEL